MAFGGGGYRGVTEVEQVEEYCVSFTLPVRTRRAGDYARKR